MLQRLTGILCTLLLLLGSAPGRADTLQSHAEQFLRASGAPGVVVAVLHRGDTQVESVAAGKACVDNDVPMQTRTVLKVGSLTKLFTGLRVQMLIADHKLTYDTPLARFFPDFPRASEITIRHMLTHTSGLPEMLMLEPLHSNLGRAWTPQEIMAMVAKHPLDFAPGTQAKYSNTGFLFLGMIIEKLTGDAYGRQILATVAKPLGMTSLRGGDDQTIIAHESCGYSKRKDGVLQKPMLASMVPPMATGDLSMTAADLVHLVNEGQVLTANLIDNPPASPYILKDGKPAKQYEHFLDMSYDKEYSEGFFIWRFRDRPMTLLGKLGMFPGFSACFFYDPVSQYGVAVTNNLESAVMEAMQTAVRILEEKRHAAAH